MGKSRRAHVRLAIAGVAIGLLVFAALAPAEADDSFTPGSGAASAFTFVFNIPYSGANIGIGVGEANASYFENNAVASAITVNPGFLNLAKILKTCGTNFPVPLPEPTTADTKRTGDAESNAKSAPQNGFGGGSEFAEATPGSAGRAESSGLTMALPGIVRIDGGDAISESKVDPGSQTRTSVADVNIGTVTLLGGIVKINGMQWHLDQALVGPDDRSHTATNTANFSMGEITMQVPGLDFLPLKKIPAGTPPADALGQINQVLAPLGLSLIMPEVKPNGERGLEITPLTVRIGGNTAYGPILYPFLAGTGDLSVLTLFNQVSPNLFDPTDCNQFNGLMKFSPEFNALYNTLGVVTPILINAFAATLNGGAFVDVSLGGVRTTLDDTYYPPRQAPPIPNRAPVSADVAGVSGTQTAGTPGRPATPGTPGAPAVLGATQTTSSTGPTTCHTTSPVGKPGCWKGAAPLAAGLAGALTLGLLVGDEVFRRRRLAALAAEAAPL